MLREEYKYDIDTASVETAAEMRRYLLDLREQFKQMNGFDIKDQQGNKIKTWRQFLGAIFQNNAWQSEDKIFLIFNGTGLIEGVKLINAKKLRFDFFLVYKKLIDYELSARRKRGRQCRLNDLLLELFNFKLPAAGL